MNQRWLLIVVTSVRLLNEIEATISRDQRKRSAVFNKATGYKLLRHKIAIHYVTCTFECAEACLGTRGCKSYNYKEEGSPLHECHLNKQSKSSAPSSDYVTDAGFSYCDTEQYINTECTCQNGGSCQISGCTSDNVCHCAEGFIGKNCENWIGLGSSSSRPGRSCLSIKKSGKDKGDGDYWIDPKRSGKPFLVECDMTTDGGGWTIVQNSTLNTSSPLGSEMRSNYTTIGKQNWFELLNPTILLNLRKDMGFDQLRYYCHKKSVGRTVHVMTAMNSTGFDAIRYLIEDSSTPAKACGSFIALPDDTSIISKNCDKLGYYQGDVAYLDRWGNLCCMGDQGRMSVRVLHYTLDPKHSIAFQGRLFFCDDFVRDNYQPGDRWLVLIR